MGRGKGKGKKQSGREDVASGEEEKMPVRRRGRPLKPVKDTIVKEEVEDKVAKVVEDEDESENTNGSISEDGNKRKRALQVMKETDNGVGTNINSNDLITKSVGFRHNGSRRKNKPRRAAEVGVECK